MKINPREQNMKSEVVMSMIETLEHRPQMFHLLNKGILLVANAVCKSGNSLQIEINDKALHGVGDGGHTFKTCLMKRDGLPKDTPCYVKVEILTGLSEAETINIIAANNKTVQVDERSLQDLKRTFQTFKNILNNQPFYNRIEFSMNEKIDNDGKKLHIVDDIISPITLFSQSWYPLENSDKLQSIKSPIHYGKGQQILKLFLQKDKDIRDSELKYMSDIIPDIFILCDKIEEELATAGTTKDRNQYRCMRFTKYNDDKIVAKSLYYQNDLQYFIPKALVFPIITAFRLLIKINSDGQYSWIVKPDIVWDAIKPKVSASFASFLKNKTPANLVKNSTSYSFINQIVLVYLLEKNLL